MKIFRLIIVLGALALGAFSQTPAAQDDEDVQSWNDVQLTIPMSKHVDFTTKLTLRFGKNISRLTDGRYLFGFVWKPTKALSISPFFWYISARNTAGLYMTENRLNVSATYRFPTKLFGLSHRSTLERRLRSPRNTWRYRAMMTVDKDIPKTIIPNAKWFIADEVFYDSATGKFSRNRFSIGITKIINKHLSLDLYYTRQNDGHTHPGDLNIIWAAWKIKL